MYTKRYGNALLSSMILLAIVSSIAIGLFKMVKYSMEIQCMDNFDIDVYDIDKGEEEALKGFMNEINLSSEKQILFESDFEKEEDDNLLKYYKDEDKLTLKYIKEDNTVRERKIYYKFEGENIVLIPSYTFIENKN